MTVGSGTHNSNQVSTGHFRIWFAPQVCFTDTAKCDRAVLTEGREIRISISPRLRAAVQKAGEDPTARID
jgi:hypothetical protein